MTVNNKKYQKIAPVTKKPGEWPKTTRMSPCAQDLLQTTMDDKGCREIPPVRKETYRIV
jgi:hypothetical protein